MSVVLDTHAVLWFLVDSPQLSDAARRTIEEEIRTANDIHISAISLIETVYLAERKRLPPIALERLRSALSDPQSGFVIVLWICRLRHRSKPFREVWFPTCRIALSLLRRATSDFR